MGAAEDDTTVLVVDDETAVADAYTAQLQREYDVRTAYGGEEALDAVDSSVDVVLLDRRMPVISGDEVLDEIRERELDCRVIMVTAVDPDFDIVEMPFEDYLQKPVDRDDLHDAIQNQLAASEYDEQVDEFLELNTKIGLLEEEKPTQELEESEEVQQIKERAESLKDDLDETVMEFDEPAEAFQNLV
ncbi:response regulator [Halovenus sp. WSH3]|uniref:Response regulator n=1 Tax=Halovenus carboxidivorans TaxID=2692199 RepID=A0A6B0T340_9EURY|nr:response regulator [Halovenus carboxidivorans]MXR52494.1 response regulator [Halovenus carboxidivorans]